MENWMIVKFDFDGISVAGIIQEFGFDPDIHTDSLPDQRFLDDASADAACEELARREGIPLFGDIVPQAWSCPQCGNRHMDTLINDGFDNVFCECGTQYKIGLEA